MEKILQDGPWESFDGEDSIRQPLVYNLQPQFFFP